VLAPGVDTRGVPSGVGSCSTFRRNRVGQMDTASCRACEVPFDDGI